MSELQHALDLFGFLSIDEIHADSLKRAFKVHILQAHPDKGGSDDIFNDILQSYVYLSETVQRVSGGRATLQNIVTPDELKGARTNEIVNRIFEEFERDEFNRAFEEKHIQETHGYSSWLKNKETDTNIIEGKFGEATQKAPEFLSNDLNSVFDATIQRDTETSSIILHPEAMAYVSGQCVGTSIIENTGGSYTSAIFTNPEYTDLYSAFTDTNIVSDKIPAFIETNKNLDDILSERAKEITPFNDIELKAIQEFEKRKLETNTTHMAKIKEYFKNDGRGGTHLENTVEVPYSNMDCDGFIYEL